MSIKLAERDKISIQMQINILCEGKFNSKEIKVLFVDIVDYALSINKTASKFIVGYNEVYSYKIEYSNLTSNVLTNVVLKDTITDSRLDYVENSCTGGCNYDTTTKTLTWTKAKLAAKEKITVEFSVKVKSGVNIIDDIVNIAYIQTDQTPKQESKAIVRIFTELPRTGGMATFGLLAIGIFAVAGLSYAFYEKKRRSKIQY